MSTFADVVKFSTVHGAAAVDDSVPEGFFSVTANMVGIPTVYLLKGEFGADDAQVVGRVELTKNAAAYRGSRIKGGFLTARSKSFTDAFHSIIS